MAGSCALAFTLSAGSHNSVAVSPSVLLMPQALLQCMGEKRHLNVDLG